MLQSESLHSKSIQFLLFLWVSIDPRSYIFSAYTFSIGSPQPETGWVRWCCEGFRLRTLQLKPKCLYSLCNPENKMLPHASLKVLYFHRTCPTVALHVIASGFSSIITRELFSSKMLCACHSADAKSNRTAASSVWPWSMQHSSISLVSLYLHYRFESPRGAGEIQAGNKQARLWWPSSDLMCHRNDSGLHLLLCEEKKSNNRVRQPWVKWKESFSTNNEEMTRCPWFLEKQFSIERQSQQSYQTLGWIACI